MYFVERLLIDHEYHAGDIVWKKANPEIGILTNYFEETNNIELELHRDCIISNSALFLCTSDVNIGDVVQVKDLPQIKPTKILQFECVLPHGIWDCDNGDWYEPSEIFKVIGEISKEAVWLHAGDLLRPDEIKIEPGITFNQWYWKNYQPYQRMEVCHVKYDKFCETAPKIVKVLSPVCKHFH